MSYGARWVLSPPRLSLVAGMVSPRDPLAAPETAPAKIMPHRVV